MPKLENLSEADIHRAILKAYLPQEICPGIIVTQERRLSSSFDVESIISRERRLIELAAEDAAAR